MGDWFTENAPGGDWFAGNAPGKMNAPGMHPPTLPPGLSGPAPGVMSRAKANLPSSAIHLIQNYAPGPSGGGDLLSEIKAHPGENPLNPLNAIPNTISAIARPFLHPQESFAEDPLGTVNAVGLAARGATNVMREMPNQIPSVHPIIEHLSERALHLPHGAISMIRKFTGGAEEAKAAGPPAGVDYDPRFHGQSSGVDTSVRGPVVPGVPLPAMDPFGFPVQPEPPLPGTLNPSAHGPVTAPAPLPAMGPTGFPPGPTAPLPGTLNKAAHGQIPPVAPYQAPPNVSWTAGTRGAPAQTTGEGAVLNPLGESFVPASQPLPKPRDIAPVTKVPGPAERFPSDAGRPTVKDEFGNPTMYADNAEAGTIPKIPPVGPKANIPAGIPERYHAHFERMGGEIGTREAMAKDQTIAKYLMSKKVTPEQWESAPTAQKVAWMKEANPKYRFQSGSRSRQEADFTSHVADTMREMK